MVGVTSGRRMPSLFAEPINEFFPTFSPCQKNKRNFSSRRFLSPTMIFCIVHSCSRRLVSSIYPKTWSRPYRATAKHFRNEQQESPVTKEINAPSQRGRQDDSLSRFPNLRSPGGILRGLDYAGTVTFALTGSVTAAQAGLDVFGCSMIGMITAVGGGTIRDSILLARKPFWTDETEYIWMTVLTGLAAFFAWPTVLKWQEDRHAQSESPKKPRYDELDASLDGLDSVGLAAFAIIGAQNGIRAGMPMVVSAICGTATSTFGGMTRDVLCGLPVRIAHSNAELYAQPALAGATIYLMARRLGSVPAVSIGLAMATCMGSRFVAIRNNIKLHTWDTEQDGLGVTVRK